MAPTTTTLAIVAHAVPQQVGDFAVLLHSGFTRTRAFAYNVAVGTATLVGALAGYFALAGMQQALPTVLASVWGIGHHARFGRFALGGFAPAHAAR